MPDIIHLLPDSVANQIAAGEVIQRPSSAVKELLENAIDAGSTYIRLIIKDSGKTLIQVIDNGCGMSETDARLCFDRHATSKIKEAADLFNIRTMGFRGEALASISAIAQVELKTKRIGDSIGTNINIEGSEVKSQEACQCPEGTAILIKNLFFNVPARRNFLKSNTVETSHILEEFYRVALPFPNIAFEMHHNNSEVHRLTASQQKQRILNIFGNNYNERLLNISAETGICTISGFTGKAEHAKKTRGEQFFFVNKRFIKSPYLHHAVLSAYEEMLPANTFPSYFIFIEIDPKEIDINIHPTKTEIKFQDDKSIYAIMKSAVKQALGKYSIDSFDFELEKSFDIPPLKKGEIVKPPSIKINPDYNPFEKKSGDSHIPSSININNSNKENWEKLYSRHSSNQLKISGSDESGKTLNTENKDCTKDTGPKLYFQLHSSYIVTQVKSGMLIVDQQCAHERILFENFRTRLSNRNVQVKQQQMFPEVIEFSPSDAVLIKEITNDIRALGFDIDEFGPSSFVINGIPADIPECNSKQVLENLLEQFKNSGSASSDERNLIIARSLARNISVKHGKVMKMEEMKDLVDQLFACSVPDKTPEGKRTFEIISLTDIQKKFS